MQGFTVQLVAYSSAGGGPAWVGRLTLDGNFSATVDQAALRALVGSGADVVAAIVTYVEPTETVDQYAPYTLTVNGAVQPGGGATAACRPPRGPLRPRPRCGRVAAGSAAGRADPGESLAGERASPGR